MFPMSTSRAYHHGDLRATLLETTRTLLSEVGVEGLSLREVSRIAGVSHAAAYNHFRDKASLMRAVVDAAFVRLAKELSRARASTSDPLEAFQRVGVAYVRFAYRNQAEFRIMFRPELCAAPTPDGPKDTNDAYQVLVDAVLACQEAGSIAAGPIGPIVLAAWSMVHGLSALIIDGPDPTLAPTLATTERLARACVDALRYGFADREGAA